MKHLTGLVAFTLAALPASALAQATSDSGMVSIDGRVAPMCILGDPNPATVNLGQMANTSGPRVGRIAVLPTQTVALPASFCNFRRVGGDGPGQRPAFKRRFLTPARFCPRGELHRHGDRLGSGECGGHHCCTARWLAAFRQRHRRNPAAAQDRAISA